MYNVILHAYVVVEVEIGQYKPAHYGQLKNYALLVDDSLKTKIDNKTIGILLVQDADEYIVEETPLILTKIIGTKQLDKY